MPEEYTPVNEEYDYDDEEIEEVDENTTRNRATRRRQTRHKNARKIKIYKTGNSYNPYKGYQRTRIKGDVLVTLPYLSYPKNSHCRTFEKKATSRQLRREPITEESVGGKSNDYRKTRDMWWNIF